MTAAAIILVLLALGAAGADWLAVAHENRRLEYVFKPLVLVLLVGAALAIHPLSETQRAWFVAALVLSLAGDVFLVLPPDRFVFGLGAFLLAHVAFVIGFLSTDSSAARATLAMTFLIIVGAVLMQRLLRGIRAARQPRLAPAVVTYGVALSVMVAAAFASRQPFALVPALLFYCSDALIGVRRFVAPRPWMPVVIIVTYHLAQVGLVLCLAL